MIRRLAFLLLCFAGPLSAQTDHPVGSWRDAFPWNEVLEVLWCPADGETGWGVEAGSAFWSVGPGSPAMAVGNDGVIAARTAKGVFTFDLRDGELRRWSTVDALSGVAPTGLAYDPDQSTLIIGYADGVIDFIHLDGTRLFTLTDIRDSNLIGNKAIRSLTFVSRGGEPRLLAACAFGVVEVHPRAWDVRNTWFLTGQESLRDVWGVAAFADRYVAWTDAGIFEAEADHPFLNSAAAWTRWADVPEETADYRHVLWDATGTPVLVMRNAEGTPRDVVYTSLAGVWQPMPGWAGARVDCAAVSSWDSEGWMLGLGDYNSIQLFGPDLSAPSPDQIHFAAASQVFRPNDLVFHRPTAGAAPGHVWVGNDLGGLLFKDIGAGTGEQAIAPDGPPMDRVYDLETWNDNLWIAPGGVDETWTGAFLTEPAYGAVDGEWVTAPLDTGWNALSGVRDLLAAAIDPLNEDHVFLGSWEEGVAELLNGEHIETYQADNSTLEAIDDGTFETIRVAGLDFDPDGNLWVTQALADDPLHVRTAEGTWTAMPLGGALNSEEFLTRVLATRGGLVFCVVSRGRGVLVYNPAGTPSDPSDDDWIRLTADETDGLPSMDVFSLEEDLDGEVWIGTSAGPAVIYVPDALFSSDPPEPAASTILIEQDGNFQMLLETEVIRAIALDGGNRKWLATGGSGVYLVSPDGTETLHHFTTSNSPLPNDNVVDIAINHRSGEVYIGTESGLMSYIGDATNFVPEVDGLKVFPNPVRPDHTGPITIDGCAYASTVTITDAAGRRVAQVESEGGRATWDGQDENGVEVPTGIYSAFVVDRFGKSAGVSTFAIVR